MDLKLALQAMTFYQGGHPETLSLQTRVDADFFLKTTWYIMIGHLLQ